MPMRPALQVKTSQLARERPATTNKLVKFKYIFDWVYQTPNELFVKYDCQLEREVSMAWIPKLREYLGHCQLTLSSTNLLHVENLKDRQTCLFLEYLSRSLPLSNADVRSIPQGNPCGG